MWKRNKKNDQKIRFKMKLEKKTCGFSFVCIVSLLHTQILWVMIIPMHWYILSHIDSFVSSPLPIAKEANAAAATATILVTSMIVIIINNHRAHILLLHYNFIANERFISCKIHKQDMCLSVCVCVIRLVLFISLSLFHSSSIPYSIALVLWLNVCGGFCFISILLTVSWIVGNKNRTAWRVQQW